MRPAPAVVRFAQFAVALGQQRRRADARPTWSGSLADKTGLYALEDVDLFNLLVMPDATEGAGLYGPS